MLFGRRDVRLWPTAQTFVIPACAVNAPHRRDRVWIVAYSDGARLERQWGEQQPVPKRPSGHPARHSRKKGRKWRWHTKPYVGRVCDGAAGRVDRHKWPAYMGQPQHEWEPPRVAQGIPDRVNRLKALGNGGMWQIPYIIGTFIKEVAQCTTQS